MPKIIVTGPECSGKTTLSRALSEHFNAPWVPEYARVFLDSLDRPYTEKDMIAIALGQYRSAHEFRRFPLVISDTGLEVIKIWSEVKYNRCSPLITHLLKSNLPDLYILCDFDIPYQTDPLREHPNDRGMLYKKYVKQLKQVKVPVLKVSGSKKERLKKSIKKIQSISS